MLCGISFYSYDLQYLNVCSKFQLRCKMSSDNEATPTKRPRDEGDGVAEEQMTATTNAKNGEATSNWETSVSSSSLLEKDFAENYNTHTIIFELA